jgi:hypothetical protein
MEAEENQPAGARLVVRCYKVGKSFGKQMFGAILNNRSKSARMRSGGPPESESSVGEPTEVATQYAAAEPAHRRSPIERAVLVPVGAALLAAEELIAVASALMDAEKAGRELLHFEERGMRARAHVEGLVHHHRGRLADSLELRIEQTRGHVNDVATKGNGFISKIRPHLPKE